VLFAQEVRKPIEELAIKWLVGQLSSDLVGIVARDAVV